MSDTEFTEGRKERKGKERRKTYKALKHIKKQALKIKALKTHIEISIFQLNESYLFKQINFPVLVLTILTS